MTASSVCPSEIHSLAIRFADLWAVDHRQMVREIYSPTIYMESMARLAHDAIVGSEELRVLEDGFLATIPDHRHELVRVTAHERVACLETTIVAPRTTEYAPACVWWWLGDNRLVVGEVGWFDWEARTPDAARSHGFVPHNDHQERGHEQWYRNFAAALADGWTRDPVALIDQVCAPECVFEKVGVSRCDGRDAAIRAGDRLAHTLPLAERWVEIHEVVAEGAVIAILFTCGTAALVSRGTAVLTLGEDDRIVSVRLYWDWSTAVPFGDVHPRNGRLTPKGRLGSRAVDPARNR